MVRSSLIVPAVAVAALTTVASAIDIHVPADQPTIQAGIDAAFDGDVVIIAPGTYAEVIDFDGKAITVRGSGGADVTIIDATTVPESPTLGKTVVLMNSGEGPESVLEGVTVTGGTGYQANWGGGMYIGDDEYPTILRCVIADNDAPAGGGVASFGGAAVFRECHFIGNVSGAAGGAAIHIRQSGPEGPLVLDRCHFQDNVTPPGGTGSRIGAIYLRDRDTEMTDCDFFGNEGSIGGAIYVNATTLSLVGCRFAGNTAREEGGAVFINASATVTAANCAFSGNTAVEGGAFWIVGTGDLSMANCVVAANVATANGGGIRATESWTNDVIDNCIFWANEDQSGVTATAQIYTNDFFGVIQLNHCIFDGGWTWLGSDNLDVDPLFADLDGTDDMIGTADDSVALSSASPAIDTGDYALYAAHGGPPFDLLGNPRVFDAAVASGTGLIDIGAIEYGSTLPSVTGACCLSGACVTTTESECAAAGGVYAGDDTTCADIACSAPCLGDLDDDGSVGFSDLVSLLSAWGVCPG